jgi:hypothetical protein
LVCYIMLTAKELLFWTAWPWRWRTRTLLNFSNCLAVKWRNIPEDFLCVSIITNNKIFTKIWNTVLLLK